MKTFFTVKLFIVLLSVAGAPGRFDFYVEKSGNSQVKPGEISVLFYMTVANGGESTIKVYSKNTKCCWIHPRGDTKYDCESMDLLGGVPVTLDPAKTGNVTYIFTNLYPMDRVGQCVFHLWHDDHKIAHTIRFNTTYVKETSWVKSLYKKIVGEYDEDYRVCDTVDLDPRRKCKPVNCVQKYNGKRNYFRKATRMCEPVHECYTERDDDDLPTSAFDKDHNKCKSLIQKELSRDEEQHMKDDALYNVEASQRERLKNIGPNDPIPVRCNHGKRVGSICVCDDGWKTDTSNVPLGDPKFIYNWCNVKTRKKPLIPYKHQKYCMITGLSLTSFTLLVAWIWMVYRYLYRNETADTVQAKESSRNSFLKSKSGLVATRELIETLSDKSLKIKSDASLLRKSKENSSANESAEDSLLGSFEKVKSLQRKAGQKSKSTTSVRPSGSVVSTRSLAKEETCVSVEVSPVSLSHNSTKDVRSDTLPSNQIQKDSSTPTGSAVSHYGKSMKDVISHGMSFAGQTSKERTVETGGTSSPEKSSEDVKIATTSGGQVSKDLEGDRSTVSFAGKSVENVKSGTTSASKTSMDQPIVTTSTGASSDKSVHDLTRGVPSEDQIWPDRSTATAETVAAANTLSFSQKSMEDDVKSVHSSPSQVFKDRSGVPASAVSLSKISGEDTKSSMLSTSQLPNDRPLKKTKTVSFCEDSVKDVKSDTSASQAPKDHSVAAAANSALFAIKLLKTVRSGLLPAGQVFKDHATVRPRKKSTKKAKIGILSASEEPEDRPKATLVNRSTCSEKSTDSAQSGMPSGDQISKGRSTTSTAALARAVSFSEKSAKEVKSGMSSGGRNSEERSTATAAPETGVSFSGRSAEDVKSDISFAKQMPQNYPTTAASSASFSGKSMGKVKGDVSPPNQMSQGYPTALGSNVSLSQRPTIGAKSNWSFSGRIGENRSTSPFASDASSVSFFTESSHDESGATSSTSCAWRGGEAFSRERDTSTFAAGLMAEGASPMPSGGRVSFARNVSGTVGNAASVMNPSSTSHPSFIPAGEKGGFPFFSSRHSRKSVVAQVFYNSSDSD